MFRTFIAIPRYLGMYVVIFLLIIYIKTPEVTQSPPEQMYKPGGGGNDTGSPTLEVSSPQVGYRLSPELTQKALTGAGY